MLTVVGVPTWGDHDRLGTSVPSEEGGDEAETPRFLSLSYTPEAQEGACPRIIGSVWFGDKSEESTLMSEIHKEASEVKVQSEVSSGKAGTR